MSELERALRARISIQGLRTRVQSSTISCHADSTWPCGNCLDVAATQRSRASVGSRSV